jgi:nicotinate phosphoribosyltransferase
LPRRKHSSCKATWPGSKQVWRQYAPTEAWPAIILVETDRQPGQPLMEMVMQNGRRIRPSPPSSEIRDRAARRLEQLPEPLRRLETGFSYSVKIADALIELSKQVDRRLAEQELADA